MRHLIAILIVSVSGAACSGASFNSEAPKVDSAQASPARGDRVAADTDRDQDRDRYESREDSDRDSSDDDGALGNNADESGARSIEGMSDADLADACAEKGGNWTSKKECIACNGGYSFDLTSQACVSSDTAASSNNSSKPGFDFGTAAQTLIPLFGDMLKNAGSAGGGPGDFGGGGGCQ